LIRKTCLKVSEIDTKAGCETATQKCSENVKNYTNLVNIGFRGDQHFLKSRSRGVLGGFRHLKAAKPIPGKRPGRPPGRQNGSQGGPGQPKSSKNGAKIRSKWGPKPVHKWDQIQSALKCRCLIDFRVNFLSRKQV